MGCAEGRRAGGIKEEIIETLEYLTRRGTTNGGDGAHGLGISLDHIKLYKGTPTIFSLITTDRLFLNPYTYQATAKDGFCVEIERKGGNDMYGRFVDDHFHKPWNNADTTVTLSTRILSALSTATLADVFPDRARDLGVGTRPPEHHIEELPAVPPLEH